MLPFEIGSNFNLIQSTIALPEANIDDLTQMGLIIFGGVTLMFYFYF